MAYDKVVDSSVLNAGLKQISDAIREKTGTSDSLAFPDAMAEAIAAIEAGGSGVFAFGLHTPTATQSSRVTITHGLSVFPKGFAFIKRNRNYVGYDTICSAWETGNILSRAFLYNGSHSVSTISTPSSSLSQITAQNHTNNDIVCGVTENTFQTPTNLSAGEYLWVMWA